MLQTFHSYWAYLLLVVLIVATFNAIIKFFTDKPYVGKDFSLALFALITMHIQFLIGLILYVTKFNVYFGGRSFSEVMQIESLRTLAIEHPSTMIIAIALLTIGYSKHKKKLVSQKKFKLLSIFYSLSLILVLSMIPWKTWLGL